MEREDRAITGGVPSRPAAAPPSPLASAPDGPPPPSPAPPAPGLFQHAVRLAPVALAVLACAVGLVLFLRVPPPGGQGQEQQPLATNLGLFPGWGKPDIVLVLSGQQNGYLQPCGCSNPQYGGLARRFAFLQTLKERGWSVVAVDLGDIADLPKRSTPLTTLKYVTSMKALKLMDYTAVSFGFNEMSMPLDEALNSYSLNNPTPRVVAVNLLDREKKGDRFHETVMSWEVAGKGGAPKVGVVALISPSVEKAAKDPSLRFATNTPAILEKALKEMQALKAEVNVLLYQGTPRVAKKCAEFCAEQRQKNPDCPALHVVLTLNEEEEPAGIPEFVGNTMIVGVGQKGRYVGVVGATRTGKADRPWELRYQLTRIGPEYQTPKGQEAKNPVMELMEDYAEAVKAGDHLEKFLKSRQKKHPVQIAFKKSEYVGADACQGCHQKEYEIWKHSKHAHAYDKSLVVTATQPKNRQYDPECVVCHVVGYGYEKGFVTEAKTPDLKNVGCESCHGPSGEHADNPRNLAIRDAINPYRAKPNETPQARKYRINQLDIFCQKCHDVDNDVHWKFEERWPEIVHMRPNRPLPPAVKGGK